MYSFINDSIPIFDESTLFYGHTYTSHIKNNKGHKIVQFLTRSRPSLVQVVPQDLTLFNDSIKANIEYIDDSMMLNLEHRHPSMDEIIKAKNLAGIHAKILMFPGE